jgi:predicted nucleic acid-binding protein
MRTVFADAGYWIALLNPKDNIHDKAVAASRRLNGARVITSVVVLIEVLNFFAAYGPVLRGLAVDLVNQLQASGQVEILPLTSDIFSEAFRLYTQRRDKEWGMADCISFEIMKQWEIREALAYDHHFEQAGYVALLRLLHI